MYCDRLWHNARLATLAPNRPGLGIIDDGVIACRGGAIVYAGPRTSAVERFESTESIDCERRWITPGLIDCHTHLIYAGNRANEFEQRRAGVSYEKIAQSGGGIASTVAATRNADDATLLRAAERRLDALISEGVTTVEIKSGYGLTLDHERKLLRLARQLGKSRQVEVVTTFLGLHACPPEFKDRSDAYVDNVCQIMLPALMAEGLIDAVDAFCDTVGFTLAQVRRFFNAAARCRLPIKLHAEQLSNQHGAALAAEFGALSADHLEHLDESGADAMAAAKVVAVLLPGAFYCLRETKVPPVDQLRARRIPMAIATDCNPGSSPLTSPLLAMNMAATMFGLSTDECIAGFTREAARALGKQDRVGTLHVGQFCDLAIWDVDNPSELVHGIGFNPLHTRVWRGK